jgi:cytochrome c peroxidase
MRSGIIALLLAFGCNDTPVDPSCPEIREEPNGYRWNLPAGFPRPNVPEDNAMSEAKVVLGRHLFYDRRLSLNETQSCASCHKQSKAFTDGRMLGLGSTGEDHPRNAMSLANVAYLSALNWADPTVVELEPQALIPMFGDDPIELGMGGMERLLLERLRAEPRYQALFPLAFPEETDPFSVDGVARALASFERTMISGDSPYDRYARGDPGAISESAQRGLMLFESERLSCSQCHTGFNFQDSFHHACTDARDVHFHNTGLYNLGGTGAFPSPNTGVHAFTGVESDMGRFRVPTLRNIAVTPPYMHDGSIATLDEVLDHYAAGGRAIASGPFAGDGSQNPYKSDRVHGFELGEQERLDLIAFLQSLTDETFLTNPALSNPWMATCELCN